LPFLRFTRDKRGYETTSLVHPIRHGGRTEQRVLYWFRTPPGVKVGRPALDQDAIRVIEEQNPDIEFDWPKILEARPPAEPPAEDLRNRRGRRDKPERRRRPRPEQGQGPPSDVPAAASARALEQRVEPEAMIEDASLEDASIEGASTEEGEQADLEAPIDIVDAHSQEPPVADDSLDDGDEVAGEGEEDLVQAFEQLTHPETEERAEPVAMPVQGTVDPEHLTRLRARFAELQARITERGGDPERVKALRAQAEPLNPDTWVTEDEVRKGIEGFEPRIRDLRATLGLRRRRRSRRGGRRRRGGGGGAPPAESPPGASE